MMTAKHIILWVAFSLIILLVFHSSLGHSSDSVWLKKQSLDSEIRPRIGSNADHVGLLAGASVGEECATCSTSETTQTVQELARETLMRPLLWAAKSLRTLLLLCHYPVLTISQWKSKAFVHAAVLAPFLYALAPMGSIPLFTRLCFGLSASLVTLTMYVGGTILAFLSTFLFDQTPDSASVHIVASAFCTSPIFIIVALWHGFDAMQRGRGLKDAVFSMLKRGPVAYALTIARMSVAATIVSIVHAVLTCFG